MSVLAYLEQQIAEATDDDVRAKCQQAYDDYAAVLDKIKAADALRDNPPVDPAP